VAESARTACHVLGECSDDERLLAHFGYCGDLVLGGDGDPAPVGVVETTRGARHGESSRDLTTRLALIIHSGLFHATHPPIMSGKLKSTA
jgi:hypothetical protein